MNLSGSDIARIVEGILGGIIKDEHFTGLQTCIQQGDLVEQEFIQAIDDFE